MLVILDTNVIVAAIRSRRGASSALLSLFEEGAFKIAISAALIFEYEEVVGRDLVPDFISAVNLDQLIRIFCALGEHFDPPPFTRPAAVDPDDDFLLELSHHAAVKYLVTHNVRDVAAAASQYGIEVITPGRFLQMLKEHHE